MTLVDGTKRRSWKRVRAESRDAKPDSDSCPFPVTRAGLPESPQEYDNSTQQEHDDMK